MWSRIIGETFGGGSFIIFIVTMFGGGKRRKDKNIKVERWGKFERKEVSLTGSEFGYVFSCI